MKWTTKEEEVVPYPREPDIRIYLPRQQDNCLEHKREQFCLTHLLGNHYITSEIAQA